MAMSKEAQVDITSCPICFETFNTPKYLPCLHSFCEGCLQTYITSAFRVNSACNGINCPVCRNFVHKPQSVEDDKWAKVLPSNHLLVSIIDINNAKTETQNCNACARENETASAKSCCVNCSEALCESCVRSHRKLKFASLHKVIDIGDLYESGSTLQKAELYCNDHPDNKLEAYCYDHSTVCCMSCVMLSHRKCDKVESVDTAANTKKTSDEITNLEQSLVVMKKQLERFVNLQMENMAQCQGDITNIKREIENIFQNAISHLQSLRDKALEEVAAVEKESIPDYETTIEEMKCKLSAIEYDIKILDTNSEHGAPAQFLQAMTQLSEQRDMLEKFLKEKEASLRSIRITYDANDKISDIAKSAASLCSVSVKRQNVQHERMDSVSNIDLFSKTPNLVREVKSKWNITGAVCLENGCFLISKCGGKSIELLNESCTLLSTLFLPSFPHSIKMMNASEGAVVIGNLSLLFFKISGNIIRKGTELKVLVHKDFIVHKGMIYVGQQNKITVCDRSHQHLRDISVDGNVSYMAIRDDNSLCYSVGNSLRCISLDGKTVFQYAHDKLKDTQGVTVDCAGNIYVCGFRSRNVHQLSRDGQLQRIMFDDLPAGPYRISFNMDYDKAVIGCNDRLLLYTLS